MARSTLLRPTSLMGSAAFDGVRKFTVSLLPLKIPLFCA